MCDDLYHTYTFAWSRTLRSLYSSLEYATTLKLERHSAPFMCMVLVQPYVMLFMQCTVNNNFFAYTCIYIYGCHIYIALKFPGPYLSEMTPAERSSVACWPVGMCVSSSLLLSVAVRLLRFTSGKYFFHTSVRHAYCSPFHALRTDTYWPSLHSTSCSVDSKPASKERAFTSHATTLYGLIFYMNCLKDLLKRSTYCIRLYVHVAGASFIASSVRN